MKCHCDAFGTFVFCRCKLPMRGFSWFGVKEERELA